MNIKKLQKRHSKKNKLIHKLRNTDLKPIIGSTVFMNKEYKKWLKKHLDELFGVASSKGLKDTEKEEYESRKYLIKNKVKGKIVSAHHDDGDVIVKVEFNLKKMKKGLKSEMLLDITNIKV